MRAADAQVRSQKARWQAQERMAHRTGVGVRPSPRMQTTNAGRAAVAARELASGWPINGTVGL
jgi:hypothetical protein